MKITNYFISIATIGMLLSIGERVGACEDPFTTPAKEPYAGCSGSYKAGVRNKMTISNDKVDDDLNLTTVFIKGAEATAEVVVPVPFTINNPLDFHDIRGKETDLKIMISYKLEDEIYKTKNPSLAALYAITSIHAGNDNNDFLSTIGDYTEDTTLINDIIKSSGQRLKQFIPRMSEALHK